VQLACIERDNAKRIDTITEAQTMHFISQDQIMRAKQFSGVVQDDQERVQDAAFKPTK